MTFYEYLVTEASICEEMALVDGDAREQKEWRKRARSLRRHAKELSPEVAKKEWRGEHLF